MREKQGDGPLPDTPAVLYFGYLERASVAVSDGMRRAIQAAIDATRWEQPETAPELNNVAVLALVEAEHTADPELRAANLAMALQSLSRSVGLDPDPLSVAHLCAINVLAGNYLAAAQDAYAGFMEVLVAAQAGPDAVRETAGAARLLYLPPDARSSGAGLASTMRRREQLQAILQAAPGSARALLMLGAALERSQPVFYGAYGLRLLHLAVQLFPGSVALNLRLGLSSIANGQLEGLLYLQRACAAAPDFAPAAQALYLAYKFMQQPQAARQTLESVRARLGERAPTADWAWLAVGEEPFTCVRFDEDLILAVDASLQSRVTGVLLAEGDWFEPEMELWRARLEPGMTVIDVGASTGVYAFSAARKVGSGGTVLAVEPFPVAVRCLEESRRLNRMPQVRICAGAASDRNGTARLAMHAASEENAILDAAHAQGPGADVACFTLDSLVAREGLARVDWLKIDAEGHELQVLAGSERLLAQFSPAILYENQSAEHDGNLAVAELLRSKGYRLFHYRPYVRELTPIESPGQLSGLLNIVALPERGR